jgi:hypothetical protein
MSQDPSILISVAGLTETPESAYASRSHTGQVTSDGLGPSGSPDNSVEGTGAVRMPAQRAGSLSLPYTDNRSLDLSAAERDKIGCDRMRGRSFLNVETGQLVPARCGGLRCSYCLRANSRKRARAISSSCPERAILLTQVGDDWQAIRSRMFHLRADVANEVGPFQWVWHVEPNPLRTGHHVHAWQHSAFIPQRLLAAKADGVGMGGFARINRIRSEVGAGVYGLKGISYGLKGVAAEDEGLGYLVDNGWRLTHQSRGYFRVDGQPVSVKNAERSPECCPKHRGSEDRCQWVLVATPK